MDIVTQILNKAAKDAEKFKTTEVEKHLDLEIDLGSLVAFDINQLDLKELRLVFHCFLFDRRSLIVIYSLSGKS